MTYETVVFYVLAAIIVGSGLAVIFSRNAVHAALALVLSFFTASGIWLLLGAEFLAVSLILVYVGAVMVLFLFVVMMLDINIARMKEGYWNYLLPALVIAGILLAEMILVLGGRHFGSDGVIAFGLNIGESNTRSLGRLLYTQYIYAFEIAAVILLVAIVAAIGLTMRKRKDNKYVDPSVQFLAKKEDRVRLVSMPPEPKKVRGDV